MVDRAQWYAQWYRWFVGGNRAMEAGVTVASLVARPTVFQGPVHHSQVL